VPEQTSPEGADDRAQPGDVASGQDEAPTADAIEGATSTAATSDVDAHEDQVAEAQAAIDDARRRVAEAPAEVVIANHVMGLYELAAIHLSADRPNLAAAALAIDAVACLVDGLGDRLGPDAAAMRDALNNIRLAFVQVKGRDTAPSSAWSPPDGDGQAEQA